MLRAPFPYFGGKSRAAHLVWGAIGRVANYVEPFFGSGAVLLARPRETWATPDGPGTETVNDRSRFLANFWRAVAADPETVAAWCDWPVNESDLLARHRWLVDALPALATRLDADPSAFDAKIAGWWCWGACAWIGGGWCDEGRAPGDPAAGADLGTAGQGVHRAIPQQVPHLGDGGRGVPILGETPARRKLPHLGGGGGGCGRGITTAGMRDRVVDLMYDLSTRLRRVRVACGDWSRITGDSVTWRHGTTGVFLDPPYAEGNQQYAAGGTRTTLSADVRAWAIEAGKRRDMRIVLAGLEGEHEMPGWRVLEWKARGGYGSQGATANGNRHRERLWCSPACVDPTRQRSLFA